MEIAMCRLAKYDNIGEALNFREVIEDIKKIGLGRYIGWYVLVIIICIILGIFMGIINCIPYIGILVGLLFISPFISLFVARSLGTLYSEVE